MNISQLLFGQVAYMVNFYADLFMEQDRAAFVSQPNFGARFNLPTPEETFDFIIVGGGTAGCLVANRLARAPWPNPPRVLLLEAGGNPPPPTFVPGNAPQWGSFESIQFKQESVPQKLPHANSTRVMGASVGKVLGGTSVANYMFYNRGSPHDYDNWANLTADASWSYANLLKHFKAVESYAGDHSSDQHGFDGELTISTQAYAPGADRFLAAGAELGYPSNAVDPNGPQRLSFTRVDVNKKAGQRVSSFEAFLRKQEAELPNLVIRRYSQVGQVLFEGTTAVGVSYTRHGFPFLAYASKEVILSAGAFGSPQILLRSGVGPAEELEALGIKPCVGLDLPVGRYLQDHPILPLVFQMRDGSETYTPDLNLTLDSMQEFLRSDGDTARGGGALSSVAGLAAQAFIASSVAATEGHPGWSDLQLALYSSNRGVLPVPPSAVDNLSSLVYCWIYLGRPKSASGSVKLNPDDSLGYESARGPPLIDFDLLSEPVDVEMLVEGIKIMLRVFENTTVYREHGAPEVYPVAPQAECGPPLVYRSDDYWKCYISHTVRSGSHPTSTCSMGKVVDSKLRVLGARNLRVIDASVMPVITNANIQAAVYVVGAKGAEDILEAHAPEGGDPSGAEELIKCKYFGFIVIFAVVFTFTLN